MSEQMPASAREVQQRGAPGLTWAIILISVGGLVLANNLKIVNVNWFDLFQFWPVILILIGLDVLIGRHSLFGSLATAAIALLVIGGIVWFFGIAGARFTPLGPTTADNFSKELGGVESIDATIKLGAGETKVSALSGGDKAVEGSYTTNTTLKVTVDYDTAGSVGRLTVVQSGSENRFNTLSSFVSDLDLRLAGSVPVDLTVDAGVGRVVLDLRDINLRSLTVHGGMGDLNILLPAQGDYVASFDVGVGKIDVRVPKSLAARVEFDSGLSTIDLPPRFAEAGEDRWETPGYDGASDRVLMQIDAGVGSVDIVE